MNRISEKTQQLFLALLTWIKGLTAPAPAAEAERGDVPGWVMITMMTAILVAGLLIVAQDALINMFNAAMARIGG